MPLRNENPPLGFGTSIGRLYACCCMRHPPYGQVRLSEITNGGRLRAMIRKMPQTRRSFLSTALLTTAARGAWAQSRKTRYLILVTADGLRWQDLFSGIDAGLMNEKAAGMDKAEALRKRLWRTTPEERRIALLPFFWGKLASQGVVLGNVAKGSSVRVTNRYRV